MLRPVQTTQETAHIICEERDASLVPSFLFSLFKSLFIQLKNMALLIKPCQSLGIFPAQWFELSLPAEGLSLRLCLYKTTTADSLDFLKRCFLSVHPNGSN